MKKIAIKYEPSTDSVWVRRDSWNDEVSTVIDAWPQSPLEYEIKNFEVRDDEQLDD